MIKKVFDQNKSLILVILSYIIIDQFNYLQPYFREAFKDNPDVSHFFVWFLFQLGMSLILFTLLWKAPFRKEDRNSYFLTLPILFMSITRIILILCLLSGFIGQSGLKVDVKFLYIFMNKGEFNVPFLGDYGLPNIMYYVELLILVHHFISRVRHLVDNTYRSRHSFKTFRHLLYVREGRKE